MGATPYPLEGPQGGPNLIPVDERGAEISILQFHLTGI
jgi:hypothetical protein